MDLPFSGGEWVLLELAIALAYIVFGVAGFGTALYLAERRRSAAGVGRQARSDIGP